MSRSGRLGATLLVLAACRSSTPAEALPDAFEGYGEHHAVKRFDQYEVPGVTLWSVSQIGVADMSATSVVGVDASGALVVGWELFRRATELPADQLAWRALGMLMAKAHARALDAERDRNHLAPAEQWALVRPPTTDGGALVFWTWQGEMRPELLRVRLDLTNGELERTTARDILHPPPDPAPPIRALLASEDVEKVREGLMGVGELRALAPDVAALLSHPNASIRMSALGVLGNLADPAQLPAVVAHLRGSERWDDRSLAGQALMAYGTPAAIAAVREHVARGGSGAEVQILREILAKHDAGDE